MAFDFLGTFTSAQLDALEVYARAHLQDVAPRIQALKGEVERLGWVAYQRDATGLRTAYQVQPSASRLAKLTLVYTYAGGSLEDLQIRSRGDWIYLQKGSWDLRENVAYLGGVPSEGNYRSSGGLYNDQEPGTEVERIKELVVPAMKRRIEGVEYEIKRCVDRSDQLIDEIVLLIKRSTGAETLDDLITNLNFMLASADYPTVNP
jgi:hypothetical protein